MKKLENYGVLELNAKEIIKIEGGFFGTLALAVAVLAAATAYVEAVETFYDAGVEIGKEITEAALN
ncbi:hypothetical protein [Lutibacter sp.]|uniref:hypothetical protein n=1 Tax=Lutibacter sp. TaxID=1925666 RepID=UPI0025B97594|nr:hypothetical protein [Lutibacter sp.]MCF6168471.1 hypothetical protein [Lutibacter sp.]